MSESEPGPREILAIDLAGTTVERLTNCAAAAKPCDYVQVAPAPDRNRVAAIRTEVGAEPGATALYFIDLSRSVETLLQARRRVFVRGLVSRQLLPHLHGERHRRE